MNCQNYNLGIQILQSRIVSDYRGNTNIIYEDGCFLGRTIPFDVKQINSGYSLYKNTVHGLHFQEGEYSQAKVVLCLSGSVYSVGVDIRENSETFGKYYGSKLIDKDGTMMYLPRGFAHGYLTLEDNTTVLWVADNAFCKESTKVIRFDDPEIGINWGVERPVVSRKDENGIFLNDYNNQILKKHM